MWSANNVKVAVLIIGGSYLIGIKFLKRRVVILTTCTVDV